jgi:hypothetical protein
LVSWYLAGSAGTLIASGFSINFGNTRAARSSVKSGKP